MDIELRVEAQQDLERFCHEVASRGLVKCSSGNATCRLDSNHILYTGSRTWMERLTPGGTGELAIDLSENPTGPPPTSEINAHLAIHALNREDIKVVLHFQSPCATTLACGNCYYVSITPTGFAPQPAINFNIIPEVPYYIGEIGHIDDFHVPGSPELANAVGEEFKNGKNLVILKNHGIFAGGKDFDHVLQMAEFFELACSILLQSRISNNILIDSIPTDWVDTHRKG